MSKKMAIRGMKEPDRCETCGNWIIPDAQGIAEHDCPLVCKNCGHRPCPFCCGWCDGDDFDCCDGECEYENYEILWHNDHWREIYAAAENAKSGD